MNYQSDPAELPPSAPPGRHHPWLAGLAIGTGFMLVVAGSLLAGTLLASSPPQKAGHPPAARATTPASAAAPAPAVPDPKGTYTGSCAYTLGDNPAGGTAMATAEVDLVNTGNIGTTDRVTISWPQLGYAPITATRTVNSAAGASTPVPFSRPLSSTELDNLQNYEMGHLGTGDYCTYAVTIMSTFGAPR